MKIRPFILRGITEGGFDFSYLRTYVLKARTATISKISIWIFIQLPWKPVWNVGWTQELVKSEFSYYFSTLLWFQRPISCHIWFNSWCQRVAMLQRPFRPTWKSKSNLKIHFLGLQECHLRLEHPFVPTKWKFGHLSIVESRQEASTFLTYVRTYSKHEQQLYMPTSCNVAKTNVQIKK